MKRMAKVFALTIALAVLPALSLAEEDFGSASVNAETTYTLTEMLNYAMQDEYLAEAEYLVIQDVFGVENPFTNIMQAEISHQEALLQLFEAYSIPVPENTAAEHVVIPETLQEIYDVGVQAEIMNIAMYEAFLAQPDLPQDVKDTFTALMNASQNHLQAFSRNAEKEGMQMNNSQGGQGKGNGNMNMQPAQPQQQDMQTDPNTEPQQNRKGNGGN